MDNDVKNYADAIFEGRLQESAKTAREDMVDLARQRAASAGNMPISGIDFGRRAQVLSRHVERCVSARFESYEEAYRESNRIPSTQDLDFILEQCRQVRTVQIGHATRALQQQLQPNQPAGAIVAAAGSVETTSAHGFDGVLSRWKQWKAKNKLRDIPIVEKERQKDVLLPVLNRAEFDADLVLLSGRAGDQSPLSLIFMDLDEFKSINDGPGGHAAGDRALRDFAAVVLRVSKSKGVAYRYGGDELCVLLENHTLDEAYAIAERICHDVSDTDIDGPSRKLSTSIGVACLPQSTGDPSVLCASADAAMYESKKAGGNCVRKSETSEATTVHLVNSKPSKDQLKKQLAAFMKEGKTIQNGIAYNNHESLREKAAWEKRVEDYLLANLDESYVVQFHTPSREANEHPHGIMLGSLPAWRELTSRMWMLSDFISKLRD